MSGLLLVPVLLIIFVFQSDCVWNGKEATIGDFIYLSFRIRNPALEPNKRIVECGGSILSEYWILASGACGNNIKSRNLLIYLGSIDLTQGCFYFTVDNKIIYCNIKELIPILIVFFFRKEM